MFTTTGIGGDEYFYFSASEPDGSTMHLFRTDGTEAGTVGLGPDQVRYPTSFVNYKGKTYFIVNETGLAGNLYSVIGDEVELVYNSDNTGVSLGSTFMFNGSLFFKGYNAILGSEFWKSDGSTDGLSAVVQDNLAENAEPFAVSASGKYIYFTRRINGEERAVDI